MKSLSINSEEAQEMITIVGKAHFWDKLEAKLGLGVMCALINGDAEVTLNEYSKPTVEGSNGNP